MLNEFIMLLKAQITLCSQLLALGEQQKCSLIDGAATKTQLLSKRQEGIFSQFNQLETKKQKFLQQKQADYPQQNVCQPMDLMALADKSEQRVLKSYIEQLVEKTVELRAVLQQNQKLMQQAMLFIDYSINIMTQTTADDIYAPQGQNGSIISKKKMFDRMI